MIPESQFETWAKQGATQKAMDAHNSIRLALGGWNRWTTNVAFDTYLQGSYRNATNIWKDSDVDLVVELTNVSMFDTNNLNPAEYSLFNLSTNWVSYSWNNFQREVLDALYAYYGYHRVEIGKKTLKVRGFEGGLIADIVVCMKHCTYYSYPLRKSSDLVEGITFFVLSENRWVVNYPKMHIENGQYKNSLNRRYKSTVRVFKNFARYLRDRDLIAKGVAPSYFIECLLYNVPNEYYKPTYQQTFLECITWIVDQKWDNFVCQNERINLFGPTAEQWKMENAVSFLRTLYSTWENWRS